MSRASRPRWRGSRTAAARSWRSASASARRRRRCSASITPTSSIPTAICPSCTTSGCSVVRWEKTTRPFLRTREFLLAGGPHHPRHRRGGHCRDRADAGRLRRLLRASRWRCRSSRGRKTDSDKFAGAEATYAIEALMHDGKALQAGTSHYFGDGFARAFDIHVYQ